MVGLSVYQLNIMLLLLGMYPRPDALRPAFHNGCRGLHLMGHGIDKGIPHLLQPKPALIGEKDAGDDHHPCQLAEHHDHQYILVEVL